MKIVHYLWALENGGAQNLVVDLANEQSRAHEVILLTANGIVDPSVLAKLDPAVLFVCVGRPAGSRNPYWVARLLLALGRLRPDVVHAHADKLALLGAGIAAPLVLTVHDMHMALTAAAKRFEMVCCISESVLRDVSGRYPSLKVRQVNNGILIPAIATGHRQPSERVRGVQVSRLVHQKKGQDLLIRALAIVNAPPNAPKLTIDFVGEGPSLGYLRACANEHGVEEFCRFLGVKSRSEVYASLCKYDILVQPSRYEGFGLTVAEGMAAKVAVVVSDVDGPMEIINRGEFGHFFKSGDAESLAATLNKVISTLDTPERAAMSDAARLHAVEQYSVQQTASHYCRIYEEVLHDLD